MYTLVLFYTFFQVFVHFILSLFSITKQDGNVKRDFTTVQVMACVQLGWCSPLVFSGVSCVSVIASVTEHNSLSLILLSIRLVRKWGWSATFHSFLSSYFQQFVSIYLEFRPLRDWDSGFETRCPSWHHSSSSRPQTALPWSVTFRGWCSNLFSHHKPRTQHLVKVGSLQLLDLNLHKDIHVKVYPP